MEVYPSLPKVNLVNLEILVQMVLLASTAHPAGRETPDHLDSLVSIAEQNSPSGGV